MGCGGVGGWGRRRGSVRGGGREGGDGGWLAGVKDSFVTGLIGPACPRAVAPARGRGDR